MVMPFLMLAVLFRAIENFKMFDMVNLLTSGGPGSTTELVSITLKRAAFEKWRTGYSSALAIILFVTVFGAANILREDAQPGEASDDGRQIHRPFHRGSIAARKALAAVIVILYAVMAIAPLDGSWRQRSNRKATR